MNDSPRLPYGYEDNVTCTEDKTGRIVIHWPEGCRGTVISRELLDAIVEEKNNCQRWIPVEERLPPTDEPVLACWSRQKVGMGCAIFRNLFGKYCWTPADQWAECDEPIAWMPLPEPPEVK